MAKVRSWAGLDVHARKVIAATIDSESGELRAFRLPGETSEVVKLCASLPGPTRVAYEAGPTGYGLARAGRRGDRLHRRGAGQDRAPRPGPRQDRPPRRDAHGQAASGRRALVRVRAVGF